MRKEMRVYTGVVVVAELNEDFLRNFIVVVSTVASEFPLNELLIGELLVLADDVAAEVAAALPDVIRIGGEEAVDSEVDDRPLLLLLVFNFVGILRLGLSKLMANKID